MVPDRWRVRPHDHVRLAERDPASTAGAPGDRPATEAATTALREQLGALQDRLWAEARRSLLVVLQGMDASGKDGTIRHVFEGLDPQGIRVAIFREPTPHELAHDFLWRVHAQAPAAGEIVVFNRSHYEDVLVVRVHELVPEDVWRPRYGHIRAFEELLEASGTTIVKLLLHISRDEQARRLEDRKIRPDHKWYRNWAVSRILLQTLADLDPRYPD